MTPVLKRSLRAEVTHRKREVTALGNGLERESRELETAIDAVDEATAWIEQADETPLSGLDFDALRARHERLSEHRLESSTTPDGRHGQCDRHGSARDDATGRRRGWASGGGDASRAATGIEVR